MDVSVIQQRFLAEGGVMMKDPRGRVVEVAVERRGVVGGRDFSPTHQRCPISLCNHHVCSTDTTEPAFIYLFIYFPLKWTKCVYF